LFKKAEIAVVNLDMENPKDFLKFDSDEKYGYATKNQKSKIKNQNDNAKLKIIKAENIELVIDGSKYEILNTKYEIHLPGMFNVENALAAICMGMSEGISLEAMAAALAEIKGVPGRMESIPNEKGLNIIVDFALTPNALKRLYKTLAGVKKSDAKIIAVFGACGQRDRGKRPIIGQIVSQYADKIIITNDEPYNEDPGRIIEEISVGVENKKEGESFWKIPDRRTAIHKALEMAKSGDIVAVTGMGAEESMIIGNKKIPWNDRKVIEEELAKI